MLGPGTDGNGKCTANRLQATIETQFADEHIFAQVLVVQFLVGSQNADGKWQIVAASFLFQISRSKINGNVGYGELKTCVRHSGYYAVLALADSRIGKACQMKHNTPGNVYFNGYCRHLEAIDGSTVCFY